MAKKNTTLEIELKKYGQYTLVLFFNFSLNVKFQYRLQGDNSCQYPSFRKTDKGYYAQCYITGTKLDDYIALNKDKFYHIACMLDLLCTELLCADPLNLKSKPFQGIDGLTYRHHMKHIRRIQKSYPIRNIIQFGIDCWESIPRRERNYYE